jgi:hypothetical protein
MKHAVRAMIAIALGAGLAAAAQAQSTNTQTTTPSTSGNMQSAAPAPNLQDQHSPQTQAPQAGKQQVSWRHAASRGNPRVRRMQRQLRAAGLYWGPINGVMNRPTRMALARFHKRHGMLPVAALDRDMHRTHIAHAVAHKPRAQATGVGSSMPNTKPANAPQTTPAPSGAGGMNSTTPTTSTPPSGTPANQ